MKEVIQGGTNLPRRLSFAGNCLLAVLAVGAALGVTLIISPFVTPASSPFFLIAVMVSAWRGGLKAGFLATVLAAAANLLIVLPPTFSTMATREELSQLFVDIIASIIIGTLSAGRRRAETEREELLKSEQAARFEAENANKVKDEFLAAVSHELRTPLTTIKTLTRLLLHKNIDEAERRASLEDIASECDREIDFVNNLLDVSRIRAGGLPVALEIINVAEEVKDCVKMKRILAAEHDHKITLEIEPDLPPAVADKNALARVLRTIFENAIKYTPDGGLIQVKVSSNENKMVFIEIADNGYGIHADDLPHIFERFYRGNLSVKANRLTGSDDNAISGAGLGLYLARILIDGMKGSIEVKSTIGIGSRFIISLCAAKNRSNQKQAELINMTNRV